MLVPAVATSSHINLRFDSLRYYALGRRRTTNGITTKRRLPPALPLRLAPGSNLTWGFLAVASGINGHLPSSRWVPSHLFLGSSFYRGSGRAQHRHVQVLDDSFPRCKPRLRDQAPTAVSKITSAWCPPVASIYTTTTRFRPRFWGFSNWFRCVTIMPLWAVLLRDGMQLLRSSPGLPLGYAVEKQR